MAFDCPEREYDPDDCPVCNGSGLVYESVPLLMPGHRYGELRAKRPCAACLPELIGGCNWCAGLCGPGFWAHDLCNGVSKLVRTGTLSCPRCDQSKRNRIA